MGKCHLSETDPPDDHHRFSFVDTEAKSKEQITRVYFFLLQCRSQNTVDSSNRESRKGRQSSERGIGKGHEAGQGQTITITGTQPLFPPQIFSSPPPPRVLPPRCPTSLPHPQPPRFWSDFQNLMLRGRRFYLDKVCSCADCAFDFPVIDFAGEASVGYIVVRRWFSRAFIPEGGWGELG